MFHVIGFLASNWQKVQFNTDLLKWRSQVFIHNANVQLKLNDIKAIKVLLKVEINYGDFNLQTVGEKHERWILGLSPNIVTWKNRRIGRESYSRKLRP